MPLSIQPASYEHSAVRHDPQSCLLIIRLLIVDDFTKEKQKTADELPIYPTMPSAISPNPPRTILITGVSRGTYATTSPRKRNETKEPTP
jgi:hypothetical protein